MDKEQFEKATELQRDIAGAREQFEIWETAKGFPKDGHNGCVEYVVVDDGREWRRGGMSHPAPAPHSWTALRAINMTYYAERIRDLEKQFADLGVSAKAKTLSTND